MRSLARRILMCGTVLAAWLCAAAPLPAALLFEKSEYAARRLKLMEKIPDGVAIIWGAQPLASYYRYAQNNDFMYLTGVEIPNAVLIIDGPAKSSTLFFTSSLDAARAEGIDAELVKNPSRYTGIEHVLPYDNLAAALEGVASRAKTLYTCLNPEELYREASLEKLRTLQRNTTLSPWDGRLTRELQFQKVLLRNLN
jgi:Xaa-Pro aminopeptidase